MKRSIRSLRGYSLSSRDGEIGKVKDFYFDDDTLTVRYLVVQTGNWLSGKKVLLSTQTIGKVMPEERMFLVNLTREQIETSPDVDTHEPVSRQREEEILNYYALYHYWDTAYPVAVWGITSAVPIMKKKSSINHHDHYRDTQQGDTHLRSAKEVTGYNVHGLDGRVGNVEDFIIDDQQWRLLFLVIDTGNWLPGIKVLVSPKCLDEIRWGDSAVFLTMGVDSIRNSPEFDSAAPANVMLENRLYDYYGRPEDDSG